MSGEPPSNDVPAATVKAPRWFHFIWLVPVAAAVIAIYLAYETLAMRGPLVTLTFASGQGLAAGQTKVEHNDVAIGSVESVTLSKDLNQVVAKVRMDQNAAPLLTDHARFWVVRPRLSLTDVSGLQTLVSGSFIAIDPGESGGKPQHDFRGLDQPPGVRSDQPGQTFTLKAPTLGWLQTNAPVFYHDVTVGHLLDYQMQGPDHLITMHVFIRAPYDQFVRTETHFWNSSGISANIGPDGVRIAVESIEAVLAGGINFENFEDAGQAPAANPETTFQLYNSYNEAQNAGFHDNIHYVTYFNQSVAGLSPGSPVLLYGIRVGTVRTTKLQINAETGQPRVRVTFDVQPGRVFSNKEKPGGDPYDVTHKMIDNGVRARVDTSNLLTGQEAIGLDFVPDPAKVQVEREGDLIVWPSQGGGLQDLTNSVSALLTKLNSVPLDKIGENATELTSSLRTLAETANGALAPISTTLPELTKQLQAMVHDADRLVVSLQSGYGANSDTHQNLQQVSAEATAALRSLRDLARYLDNHPGSVIWGRK